MQVMAEPSWLDESEMAAWRAVVVTHGRLFARLDDELLRAHGLSLAEYEVLVQLGEAGCRGLRMAQLAERALVSRSGLTRRVDGMVVAGLVCRQPCPSDRRGTLALITDAGRARLDEAVPTHVAGVRRHLLDALSPEEMAVLSTALGRVGDALGGAGGGWTSPEAASPGPGGAARGH